MAFSEFLDFVKSWLPWQSEQADESRDFWMPDQSCRVCYSCDSQFSLLNRRHHCRLCGRVFCAKCTANSVPASYSCPIPPSEKLEKIRVCNFCFRQWEIEICGNGVEVFNEGPTTSPSAASFSSLKSISTATTSYFTASSVQYSFGSCQLDQQYSDLSLYQLSPLQTISQNNSEVKAGMNVDFLGCREDPSLTQYMCPLPRNDEDNEYGSYHSCSETRTSEQVDIDVMRNDDTLHKLNVGGECEDATSVSSSSLRNSLELHDTEETCRLGKLDECDNCDESESSSSLYEEGSVNAETVDFENNGLLWFPPEPADEEHEREAGLFDVYDYNDDEGNIAGEWGYSCSSGSFESGEDPTKGNPSEENKKAIKTVVDGHFRALVAQLLQVENLLIATDNEKESWLEIIIALSWEAAMLLKPDMSKGEGMDPGVYVKVKCIASGHPCESMVVKGVVCKKNVAHRRMTSKIEKPRVLILGGALEYQRVSNLLSSFDTLLQQEMEHLKMAVAKIHAHHPDVLLVEKSVSRNAQEYLLEKDISLVLNIKRPLLERIARCTSAQIVLSIDHLSSEKLGYCEKFHVDRFLEDLGTAGQGGKKLMKTLMYFEGCPKPFGCTILLKGSNGDELKKVKHVVQYGVFAAYHLAMETSFLADEGATLPVLSLSSLITMGLPDKVSRIERSISTVPGFSFTDDGKFPQPQRSSSVPISHWAQSKEKMVSANDELVTTDHSTEANVHWQLESCLQVGQSDGCKKYVFPMDTTQLTDHVGNFEEPRLPKGEFPPTTADHHSILVSSSTRCVWKGTVCQKSHLFRIKYYGNFDWPLGRFLHDQLFDQSYRCSPCEMPSEAHVHCYTHRQGTLTISVKKLPEILLPGEKEGKIWMWHRCLRCPRIDGFPPATRRVTMSDAAWGLSFGKFLELSFSNHAAASRVATCGHSLHRDCLRFYGFGEMVACFRYASIDVLSVYLPPPKLFFNFENQEWIKEEAYEIVNHAELLFSEVLNALRQIIEKKAGTRPLKNGIRTIELKRLAEELEALLQKEKQEFEESMEKILNRQVEKSHLVFDILNINRLRRQLLFQSYMWDHRITYAANSVNNSSQDSLYDSDSASDQNLLANNEKLSGMNNHKRPVNAFSSYDSLLVTMKLGNYPEEEDGFDGDTNFSCTIIQENRADPESPEMYARAQDNLLQSKRVLRTFSEGQIPVMKNLSETLDAAWIGESRVGIASGSLSANLLTEPIITDGVDAMCFAENQNVPMVQCSLSTVQPIKDLEDMEDPINWLKMPFVNLYRSFSRNFFLSAQNINNMSGYNISCFPKLELHGGARLYLPVSVNEIIIPVYDDEPSSIISYALLSPGYFDQLSDEGEVTKDDGESMPLKSDEKRNAYHSTMSGSRSSMVIDPLGYTKSLHINVSFDDDGPLGNVKYSVTFYYAKQFEVLRRICCPSELDFIRSFSRCKKWRAQGGKSNVFFAKTLDDRFIIKQVTKTELESFVQFAPGYFKYLSESIGTGSPTCLAKILGIYQVKSKHLKGGKESKMDLLVMENILYGRNVARLYDLKGSSRSRYNSDSNGNNKVLLDQNLIEAMPTSPIFVGNKAKRLLERAVWNDTSFLASADVMDYSLLVGVDEENHELVLGIIDFMRQYTWDKHLETWVKASGILGGPKNASPTVISPKQYKIRFRKAMTAYFLMVPDQWSPPVPPNESQVEENTQVE